LRCRFLYTGRFAISSALLALFRGLQKDSV
jgi:hypothetical protein